MKERETNPRPLQLPVGRHTPGPWGYTYDGSSTWSIGAADDPQEEPPHAHIWDRNDERARANTRLIAAAPELLDACQKAARYLDPTQFPGALRTIEAAVAKALGVPPNAVLSGAHDEVDK